MPLDGDLHFKAHNCAVFVHMSLGGHSENETHGLNSVWCLGYEGSLLGNNSITLFTVVLCLC